MINLAMVENNPCAISIMVISTPTQNLTVDGCNQLIKINTVNLVVNLLLFDGEGVGFGAAGLTDAVELDVVEIKALVVTDFDVALPGNVASRFQAQRETIVGNSRRTFLVENTPVDQRFKGHVS